ncbi:MAG TPA: DUF3298 domain-containing protein [Terriglobales bacterium]|nr:DUF3298 domain-containing protein [Terriglobales bacterium]
MEPMVVAIGRILLAFLVPLGIQACAATDVPPPAANRATPSTAPSPVASVVALPPSPPAVHVDVESGASPAQSGPGAYRYRVEVPQLVGLEPHGPALDSQIRGTLQRDVDAFLGAAQDAQTPTDLTCTNRTVRVTARLAVFRVDCTSSQAGVARPSSITHTFNCDLAGTRILTLQDLFSAGSAYLDVLSAAARSQFPAEAAAAAGRTVADGTAPAAANFRAFLLDQSGLVIVFPDFRVAPGTTATPQVSVPYDDLRRYFATGIAGLLAG